MNKIIIIPIIVFMYGCSAYKETFQPEETSLKEAVINASIHDFSTRCRLAARDSVFRVMFRDSVFTNAKLVSDRDGYKWKRGELIKGVAAVVIIGHRELIRYSEETKYKTLPSRYVIRDGKLFFWDDKDCPVTDETIDVLARYNLLTDDPWYDYPIDDQRKSVDYYFCKNNLSKHRKVITNIGIGYYEPPKINCKEKQVISKDN
ncbi:MAG: hypothetical protein MJY84_05850 [Bacteroidales bacterium]|nr:hypothetical protein [Bacteroidales bacterium]